MKLLLTSAGITNNVIKEALLGLLGKEFTKAKMAFVPTAANTEEGDKGWLIDDLKNCQALEFSSLDIVDISALPQDIYAKRLEEADVLVFGGGNTFHLIHWLNKTGLNEDLQSMLKTKVYVGISAGSMVATKNLVLSDSEKLYSEEIGEIEALDGLGFVDFHIRPHFNSPHFPKVNSDNLREISQDFDEPIYAIDDDTAIVVNDASIEVVSDGKWERFN